MTGFARAATLLGLALLAGCSPYKFVGDQMTEVGERHALPVALAMDDLPMTCASADSLAPLALTFEAVGTDVDHIAVLMHMGAGICAEFEAAEFDLTYLRALKQQDIFAAGDARIRQKRAHERAARHEWAAFQRFERIYGPSPETDCPDLDDEFEAMVFLVGTLAGGQAVLNDAQTGALVGVPRDIAPRVARLTECIDNEQWWYAPQAIRGALWSVVPALAPDNVDAAALLREAVEKGQRSGVRLAHAASAVASWSRGDHEATRAVIADFVAAGKRFPPDPQYRLLDTVCTAVMLGISDRIWVDATGVRTPMGGLGTFPGETRVQPSVDDLLD